MSKYTRFTTTRQVPRTLQLGGMRVSFITQEYTTDNNEEIEALRRLANTPHSGIQESEDKVDYLTPRSVPRQRITRAVTGVQASSRAVIQKVEHKESSVPLMQRVSQAATPQAQVPKSAATKASESSKVSTDEAATILKTLAPQTTANPLAPKAETK